MTATARGPLVVPLQPGIATEIFRECLTEPFARAFGVRVETPARTEHFLDDVRRDVESGGHRFDVVEWPQHQLIEAKRLGLCERIDYGALPSLADMPARYLDADGLGVGVFVWGMTLVYNPERLSSPPRRWADLWSEALRGRIALRDQLGSSYLMPATCAVLGLRTEDLGEDDNFERAWTKLADLAAQVKVWARSEGHVQELIADGTVDVAEQFIDVAQIQKDRGVPVEVAFPEEGPVWGYRSWTVVTGSRNADLAREFIDFAQAPAQQKSLCERFYGHPVNRRVVLDEAVAPRIYGKALRDEDISFPDWEWYASRPDVEARWRRLIGAPPESPG